MPRAPRSIRFVASQVERFPRSLCRARVILERPGQDLFVGTAEQSTGKQGELWCAAEAAAVALGQAVAPKDPEAVQIRGVERVVVFGRTAVLVKVDARREDQSRPLIGVVEIEGDPIRAAAVAVLSATNRFLEAG